MKEIILLYLTIQKYIVCIFVHLQLKRFKTYSFLLQAKMASYPELEPSLVEVAIGEVDEPPSPPNTSPRTAKKGRQATPSPEDKRRSKPVQRSMSDRYSYRAAIYHRETEYDVL